MQISLQNTLSGYPLRSENVKTNLYLVLMQFGSALFHSHRGFSPVVTQRF
jgi:hypothetical protein